ncbi:hypothetical protein PPYR_10067 [Photinus pyralis]|uniref:Alanyl-transfer RNA synthetases family profile domain-containing protein n=1 Tax=Photinus pyralis TaxID=7054 RepID=A0A1Y1LD60_PHOPY|nr:alanyl-tRNA editing protein Aarsd1 [Photinus pyralis]KAB0796006.1 hypothetical protein PPYR_10067 [Photinus pyralis]
MVFKCQSDSFLKEFTSKVVSCTEAKLVTSIDGKEQTVDGYEVILDDTILFPEGGGQPSDHGLINTSKVYQVKRVGDKAVHFVNNPLIEGEDARQLVNWERRFDHMQQHSGQHLISAVIEQEFGFQTLSWYLGEQVSYIELDTPTFDSSQIRQVENRVNEHIRAAKPVRVEVYKSASEVKHMDISGLPDDHVGDVRVIIIDGIDTNMCCGTHVTNLSQLQVVKMLGTEKSKRKNQLLLHFLVGTRVLQRLSLCLEREQQLTVLLKNNASEHPNLVEKLVKNSKMLTKDLQSVLKDLAAFEAHKFKSLEPKPKYYVLHRKEAEPDFMQNFLREVGPCDTLFFLSVGDDKAQGSLVLSGSETIISEIAEKVLALLNAKGVAKKNVLNAKASNMKGKAQVIKLLKDYFH